MKTLMVLGGGVYQVPLILQAKKMGLKVIVVTYKGNYPGIPLADIFLDLDTTDCEAVYKAAMQYKIDGIVTTGTDVCVPTIGYIVDKMGLTGPSFEAANKSMNKILMKDAFQKNNVATARYESFSNFDKAINFAEEIGFPVMVKAPDSSGSRGITKVDSKEGFEAAWNRACEVSHVEYIIVEQYLDGIEFGAQAFIHEDNVIAVFAHGDTVTPPPFCSPIGHSIPTSLSDEIQEKTKTLIYYAAKALGLKNCIANVDLMLVNDQPYILEIGARMGATCLPENISIYAGQNVYEYLILMALGNPIDFKITTKQANACLLLRSNKTGIIEEITIPDEVKNHPNLVDLSLDYKIGDYVRKFTVGPDRIGHVIVQGDSAEAMEILVEKLVSKISIKVKDEQ